METTADQLRWMRLALEQARAAFEEGEVPVGCVIARGGRILGRGGNRVRTSMDPTAHAEILAISAASATAGDWRLERATAYVTVEPCLMCAGALLLARVERVVFGATEPKFGALGSRTDLRSVEGLNHEYEVIGGVLAEESGALLQEFFRGLRRDARAVESGGLENRE
jgi:tRNA(adenine34) deaminase